MKKRYLFWLFIFSISSYSQAIVWTVGDKEWLPAIIVKTDQSVITGLVKEFGVSNTFEMRGAWDNFSSMESKLHLDQKSFDFKTDLQAESQNISLEELQSVTILNDEKAIVRYDKVKLKTINTKMEVVDLEREVLVPLYREGKINLYAVSVSICSPNCNQGPVIAYIKKPKDEFAFIPIDINRLNLFNLGSVEDKIIESFRQVSEDCPEFLQYLDDWKKNAKDKEFRKQFKAKWKSVNKEKDEALKTAHNSKERRKIKDDYFVKRYLAFEVDIIEKYESMCK